MNLVGNLEDLGLGEILQIVSLSRKSGVLTLKGRRGEGEIIFRNGEVVCAISPDYPKGLAELLAGKGKIDNSTKERILAEEEDGGASQQSDQYLAIRYKIPAESIVEVIREQIEKVVASFFEWKSGTFDFELQEHGDSIDSMETKQNRIILSQGISAQYLALEGARRLDHKRHQCEGAAPGQPEEEKVPDVQVNGVSKPIAPTEPEPPALEPQPDVSSRHAIVLVDNDTSSREALSESLEVCGYEVYQFSGGADSPLMRLASLHRDGLRPTLLLDMAIPRMDGSSGKGGVELLELIKSNFPDVPVLAMMVQPDEALEQALMRMGIQHLLKPPGEDVADRGVFNNFMADLLPVLNRVRLGEENDAGGGSVNFGVELLHEIGEESPSIHPPVVQSTGIALLRGMLEELKAPSLEGGIILLVLRFASEFMNRAVIFVVKKDKIEGLGQFGINPAKGSPDSVVRGMKIPVAADSIFSRVIETHIPAKLKPDEEEWTRYLLDKLGGEVPAEIFLGPVVSEDKVVAILYGDNIPDRRPIGDTDSLEIFLSQAGLAMEKALLQRKLKGKGLEVM
jgi:CheY-like chemotaxis protein